MAKRIHERLVPGQNFLKSAQLVRRLLATTTIRPPDVVYEIGAGRGRITAELARVAARVVAIEKDPALAHGLQARFHGVENVRIVEANFLEYRLPGGRYKIFANIPYHITARIIRKILDAPSGLSEAYLVMQKEAALRFTGHPRETQFSVLAKPFWKAAVLCELRRTDFEPVPRVDSVLLHFERRVPSLVDRGDLRVYDEFVRCGFGGWRKSLKLNFKRVFSYAQWRHLSRQLRFSLDAIPSELSFEQWLGLFHCFRERVWRANQ